MGVVKILSSVANDEVIATAVYGQKEDTKLWASISDLLIRPQWQLILAWLEAAQGEWY